MRIRSLPLRLQPIEGEAIDSYIEAYAARVGATSAEFEHAVGLAPTNRRVQRIASLVQLSEEELVDLSVATGLPTARFPPMTLSHFDGRAVRVDAAQRSLTYGVPWGYARGITVLSAWATPTGGGL
jgi:hypothetical protein